MIGINRRYEYACRFSLFWGLGVEYIPWGCSPGTGDVICFSHGIAKCLRRQTISLISRISFLLPASGEWQMIPMFKFLPIFLLSGPAKRPAIVSGLLVCNPCSEKGCFYAQGKGTASAWYVWFRSQRVCLHRCKSIGFPFLPG